MLKGRPKEKPPTSAGRVTGFGLFRKLGEHYNKLDPNRRKEKMSEEQRVEVDALRKKVEQVDALQEKVDQIKNKVGRGDTCPPSFLVGRVGKVERWWSSCAVPDSQHGRE